MHRGIALGVTGLATAAFLLAPLDVTSAHAATKKAAAKAAPAAAPLPPPSSTAPAPLTTVAVVKARTIGVYRSPQAPKPYATLNNRTNYSGRHVFVVERNEGAWLRVQVPMRPNEGTGYVKAAEVTTYQHDWSIRVKLSARTLTVYKANTVFMHERVAIGQPKYPTPVGRYFIRELARPSNPRGAYGPWAYGLSAYSNVLTRFGRGDGQIGVHGTNRPDLLGSAVSHGCVRMTNASITKLAHTLPQGVPIIIEA